MVWYSHSIRLPMDWAFSCQGCENWWERTKTCRLEYVNWCVIGACEKCTYPTFLDFSIQIRDLKRHCSIMRWKACKAEHNNVYLLLIHCPFLAFNSVWHILTFPYIRLQWHQSAINNHNQWVRYAQHDICNLSTITRTLGLFASTHRLCVLLGFIMWDIMMNCVISSILPFTVQSHSVHFGTQEVLNLGKGAQISHRKGSFILSNGEK